MDRPTLPIAANLVARASTRLPRFAMIHFAAATVSFGRSAACVDSGCCISSAAATCSTTSAAVDACNGISRAPLGHEAPFCQCHGPERGVLQALRREGSVEPPTFSAPTFSAPAIGNRKIAAQLAATTGLGPVMEAEQVAVAHAIRQLQLMLLAENAAQARAYGAPTPPAKPLGEALVAAVEREGTAAVKAAKFYAGGGSNIVAQRPVPFRPVPQWYQPSEAQVALLMPIATSGVTQQGINPLPSWAVMTCAKAGCAIKSALCRSDPLADLPSCFAALLYAFSGAHPFQERVPIREMSREGSLAAATPPARDDLNVSISAVQEKLDGRKLLRSQLREAVTRALGAAVAVREAADLQYIAIAVGDAADAQIMAAAQGADADGSGELGPMGTGEFGPSRPVTAATVSMGANNGVNI
ncbi:hypothetical protein T492DRAFT_843335 [Pavlovales sp. CCMP2436]|nr:hypothetical protein T492DRAFT_843335 [Pavlovales sp. CCMP2436]